MAIHPLPDALSRLCGRILRRILGRLLVTPLDQVRHRVLDGLDGVHELDPEVLPDLGGVHQQRVAEVVVQVLLVRGA